jgi:hypothetical protein
MPGGIRRSVSLLAGKKVAIHRRPRPTRAAFILAPAAAGTDDSVMAVRMLRFSPAVRLPWPYDAKEVQ